MQRRQIIQWGAASLAAPAFLAQAQSFPNKPIKLIIAFPAGGPPDITMPSLPDNASDEEDEAMVWNQLRTWFHPEIPFNTDNLGLG